MKLTSKLAVIFGVMLLIVGCGTGNIQGACSAALLIGFGTEGVIRLEGGKNGT